ncbi:MAG TPA: YceI family protein [Myxococcus sp.]|nr:YceI family protein [Myxococcus sp.]
MKRHTPLLSLLLATSTWVGAAHAQPSSVQLQPGAELVIDGKSTVRDFSCRASKLSALLAPGTPGTSLALEQLAGAVGEVQLEVPVKALDCANDTMNEHMLEALKADKYPTIRLRVTGYEVGAVEEGLAPLKLKGELTLAGITRPVTLVASARPAADGGLQVEGRYLLKMTDWGVKPPSLMLGTMKVREAVLIRFGVALK